LAFTYLFLEVKQNWTMWIIGIISSIFYVYIFFDAKLYAEMGLNAYFVVMSVYGLYCWKLMKPRKQKPLILHHIAPKLALVLLFIGIAVFALSSFILIQYTDSPVPFADALVATLGIIATWMVAQKIVECWYLWIFSNFFAIGLYLYQHLYPTAILYVFYAIMSIIGLIEWNKSIKRQPHEASVAKS
jgi:nicotinamide mononucleotide transporter PnuC